MKIKSEANLSKLKMPMKKAWEIYCSLYSLAGGEPTLTKGIRGPNDDLCSLRHDGYSIDVCTRCVDPGKASRISGLLSYILGVDYDITPYSHHINIQYQRHLDDQIVWIMDV